MCDTIQANFENACWNGDIILAKKLWLNNKINVNINSELIFRWTCKNGHIEVAQWLWQISPNIRIHIDNEYAFRYSCRYGHTNIVKWLLEIAPDINIHARGEDAIKWSRKNGNTEIVQLLMDHSRQTDRLLMVHDNILHIIVIKPPNIYAINDLHGYKTSYVDGYLVYSSGPINTSAVQEYILN